MRSGQIGPKGVSKHRSVRMAASVAKNRFGQAMSAIASGKHVEITRYDKVTAVLVPVDDYLELTGSAACTLDVLQDEFDALYERMQGEKNRAAVDAAFSSSPEALAETARMD